MSNHRDVRRLQVPISPSASATLAIGSFVAIGGIWILATSTGAIDPFFLPSPTRIAETTVRLVRDHGLILNIWISTRRILIAFFLSAMVAIPIGVLMSSYRAIQALLEPVIAFVRYLPVPALVPLTILWLGIGEASKIALLFVGTFFQLVLLVMDDANRVRPEYVELAYTLGADTNEVIRRVVVPGMLPALYDDLRITLGWCWTYLLIGELVAARSGLGYLIREAQRFAQPDVVFVGILVIGVIGLLTDATLKLTGRRLFPYQAH